MFDTARNLLLALLLLLSQAGLALHQIDFDQHDDSGACVLCLAAQGFDHTIAADFTPQLAQAAAELFPAALIVGRACAEPPFRLARSPPALTPLS